jgi:hypothetical protein
LSLIGILAVTSLLVLAAAAGGLALMTWRAPPRVGEAPPSVVLPDASRGYAMRPNLDVRYEYYPGQWVQFATDEAGLRAPQPGKSRERVDILFIGDSQTMADSVPWEQTFAARSGERLGQTIANAGVSGYGTVSMLRALQAFAKLEPRVVVVGHYYDHLDRAVSPCNPGRTYPCISVPHVLPGSDPLRIVEPEDNGPRFELERRFRAYASGKDGGYSLARDVFWKARYLWGEFYFLRWGRRTVSADDAQRVAEFLYRQMADASRAMGARLVVLYIPDYFGDKPVVSPPPFLPALVRRLGGVFVDMTPDLQSVKAQGGLPAIIIPNNGHLNAAMNALIAEKLSAAIAAVR